MLQRPQTLWILLSIISAVCSFEYPFAIVKSADGLTSSQLDAGSTIVLILLTAVSVGLSCITMLTYSNLVRQKTLCWIGIIINLALCLAFIKEWRNLVQAEFTITSMLPFISPISLWLAWLGIKNDQEMLKKLSKKK